VAKAVRELRLKHVVITSVARDDLEDGGASAFASTVRELRKSSPGTRVELLIPDLQGDAGALRAIMEAKPDILGHNLEVVERLQGLARDARASYARSLSVLEMAKRLDAQVLTKSSLMLGLGEEAEEVRAALKELRRARVDIVTLGQYLKPKGNVLEVRRYITPEEFALLREEAVGLGFLQVMAGPLVRSSYRAEEAYDAFHGG
jgi:lipoic acid synthetase